MSLFGDLFKVAFPTILSALKAIGDSQVKGENLSSEQLAYLYSGYVLIKTNFAKLVESTENEFDDEALNALAEFAADTLAEAGIQVPVIPVELQ